MTSKWVHKLKTNEFGEVTRAKARLVCRGFLQRPFDTYHPDEIYAPVASHEALRVMIASACIKRLNLYQADISNAYLQAPLRVEEGKEVEPLPVSTSEKTTFFALLNLCMVAKMALPTSMQCCQITLLTRWASNAARLNRPYSGGYGTDRSV